jgi:putative hydrolase of the HAD superfamily
VSDALSVDRSAVRAIAFDWGGVFTEGTFDGRAVDALAGLYNLDQATVATSYYPLMEHFEVGAFDLPGFQRRLQDELTAEVDEGSFRQAFLGAVHERRAMFDVLTGIPDTYVVAMLSNNVPELCDRVRSDARLARIEHFVFSNEIGVRKPDAVAFAALSEALSVAPDATVFVDDNTTNVTASQALGFQGLLLDSTTGFARRWQRLLPGLAHLVDGPPWDA